MSSTTLNVTFPVPFTLKGSAEKFSAGTYEIQIEEETVEDLRKQVHRWRAAYLVFHDKNRKAGKVSRRPISGADLKMALGHFLKK